jgi:hypothetical protein
MDLGPELEVGYLFSNFFCESVGLLVGIFDGSGALFFRLSVVR